MARAQRLVETRPTGAGRARGLVSSRVSGRRVDAHAYAPTAELADVVDVYWTTGWDLRGQAPHTAELLSDPSINVAFERGGGAAPAHRLVGVWTRLWTRTLAGRGEVRAVKLRPGALRAFVDVPAHRLANRIVPLAALLGRGAGALARAVLAPPSAEEGLVALEAWLREHRRAADPEVARAVEIAGRVASDRRIVRVEQLADAVGLAPRALERLFRDHVGASPKWVIRRHRLQEVALRLERGEPGTLARLAADLGYTDQAHLARDFRGAVGRSPSEFARAVHR